MRPACFIPTICRGCRAPTTTAKVSSATSTAACSVPPAKKASPGASCSAAGAWELLPHPNTLAATAAALAHIATPDLRQEQQHVREHHGRFRLHTRSAKQSQIQLTHLVQRWVTLPTGDGL